MVAHPNPTPHRAGGPLLLTVLCIPMFLVLLDVMAMNVAMPTLGRAFGAPTGSWAHIVDAYTVPLAIGLLPGGLLIDRIGARRGLLAGLVVFCLASTLGGLAWNWPVVLAARAAQGLAAALMLPAGLAALTTTWTETTARARALGIWSAVSAAATAVGPAVGGLLVAAASWRAVFWLNVPLVLLALAGTVVTLPAATQRAETGTPGRLRPLVASVLVAAMMTSGANGTLQVITVHLQTGVGMAAGPAGAMLLLASLPFVLLGPVTGRLVARFGRRPVAVAGFGLGAIGLLTLGRLPGLPGLVPGLLGIGVGLGLMTSAIVGETMAAWPSRPGMAGGLNNALRQCGTSVGVALGGLLSARLYGESLLTRTGLLAGSWWLLAALIVLGGFARPARRGA